MSEKEELEKKKIEVEIEEIIQNLEAKNKNAKWDKVKVVTTLALTFVSIIIGLVTILTSSATFLEQQRKNNDFELNKEMIQLVAKLNHADPYEQESAAILLSYFNEEAIPILLMNLKRTQNPEYTIQSLKLIDDNENIKEGSVLAALINEAENVFNSTNILDKEQLIKFENYVKALSDLGKLQPQKITNMLDTVKVKIRDNRINTTEESLYIIQTVIDNSINKLNSYKSQ